MTKRKILVTSALPYANGSIHLGHLVEYIQTDIWVRFQKLSGNECYYMCADDTHGTPIMLSAKRNKITPEELIAKMHLEHSKDFSGFGIKFDNYYTTNSPENKELAEFIYNTAKASGYIAKKEIAQAYCEKCQMFLPDRFIKGKCPKCGAEDQYGDACEVCSTTYDPLELVKPYCIECGSTPVKKRSTHYFFKLSALADKLQEWLKSGHVAPEIYNKLQEWFKQGLQDWDISRDAPYFGFKIPGTENKFFYVWLDAPVGYIATTKNWCDMNNYDFESIWKKPGFEIHHFIGKDILYFHTLFWPAMLMVSGFRTPDQIHIHGFLTVNGEKMSKSRGTFIKASQYLESGLNPEFLRYYYASKLTSTIDDLDLNLNDFLFKVNSEIVNKFVNIGSRLGSIVNKKLDNKISAPDSAGQEIVNNIIAAIPTIKKYYEELEYGKAIKEIMKFADDANKYIDTQAPWNLVKTDAEKARAVCTSGFNFLKIFAGLLKPVIPTLAAGVEKFLKIDPLDFTNLDKPLKDQEINNYERLAERIEKEQLDKLVLTGQ
jgi:methionyl-tRNA synthetase